MPIYTNLSREEMLEQGNNGSGHLWHAARVGVDQDLQFRLQACLNEDNRISYVCIKHSKESCAICGMDLRNIASGANSRDMEKICALLIKAKEDVKANRNKPNMEKRDRKGANTHKRFRGRKSTISTKKQLREQAGLGGTDNQREHEVEYHDTDSDTVGSEDGYDADEDSSDKGDSTIPNHSTMSTTEKAHDEPVPDYVEKPCIYYPPKGSHFEHYEEFLEKVSLILMPGDLDASRLSPREMTEILNNPETITSAKAALPLFPAPLKLRCEVYTQVSDSNAFQVAHLLGNLARFIPQLDHQVTGHAPQLVGYDNPPKADGPEAVFAATCNECLGLTFLVGKKNPLAALAHPAHPAVPVRQDSAFFYPEKRSVIVRVGTAQRPGGRKGELAYGVYFGQDCSYNEAKLCLSINGDRGGALAAAEASTSVTIQEAEMRAIVRALQITKDFVVPVRMAQCREHIAEDCVGAHSLLLPNGMRMGLLLPQLARFRLVVVTSYGGVVEGIVSHMEKAWEEKDKDGARVLVSKSGGKRRKRAAVVKNSDLYLTIKRLVANLSYHGVQVAWYTIPAGKNGIAKKFAAQAFTREVEVADNVDVEEFLGYTEEGGLKAFTPRLTGIEVFRLGAGAPKPHDDREGAEKAIVEQLAQLPVKHEEEKKDNAITTAETGESKEDKEETEERNINTKNNIIPAGWGKLVVSPYSAKLNRLLDAAKSHEACFRLADGLRYTQIIRQQQDRGPAGESEG